MKKKTIAILGSKGTLGSDLVRYLSASFVVTPIDRSTYVSHVGKSFDVLINANGNSKRFWANTHPREDFVASTVSVYNSLFDFSYKKFIYISSSDVYADHANLETTHEEQVDGTGLSFYGFNKYLSERIIYQHAKDFLILRSSLILGTQLKKGPFYDARMNIPLFISKASQLQIITTEEIATIIQQLFQLGITREIYNMGSVDAFPIGDLASYFPTVKFQKDAETQSYQMNIQKLKRIFPLKTSEVYIKKFLSYLK